MSKTGQTPLLLNARQREILHTLHTTRFVSTRQLATLLSRGLSTISRLLQPLRILHYVKRLDQVTHCPQGADCAVYTLGPAGIEYVAAEFGVPERLRRRRAERAASPLFVDHYLAIADVYIALARATQTAGLDLEWHNELEADFSYRYGREEYRLSPDAIFWLDGATIPLTVAFLEVDRTTESLKQWGQKLGDYARYARTQAICAQWGRCPPRVLLLVTTLSPDRAETLRRYTAIKWRDKPATRLFRVGFVVHAEVRPEQVLALPWQGLDDKMFRLIE